MNYLKKITVVVLSYNSEKTIIETLDSISNQTYGSENIELIISDDGSSDQTIQVVKRWLYDKESHFHKVILFCSTVNQGVSANCNRAWRGASSEWIKSIAADDLLTKECLDIFAKYVNDNTADICFSAMRQFSDDGKANKLLPTIENMRMFDLTACEQHGFLSRKSFNFSPTSFIKKDLLEKFGYADTSYRNFEDFPLWIKLTKSGVKLHFINEVTVKYRFHESISNSFENFYNPSFVYSLEKFYTKEIYPSLNSLDLLDRRVDFLTRRLIISLGNKKNRMNKSVLFFSLIFRPITVSRLFKKVFR